MTEEEALARVIDPRAWRAKDLGGQGGLTAGSIAMARTGLQRLGEIWAQQKFVNLEGRDEAGLLGEFQKAQAGARAQVLTKVRELLGEEAEAQVREGLGL